MSKAPSFDPRSVETSELSESNLVAIYQQALDNNPGLSVLSQRLLRIIISLIDPKMKPDVSKSSYSYFFTMSDYQRVYNVSHYPKEEIESLGRELSTRFTLQNPYDPKHSITTGLINDVEVNGGTVKVTVSSYMIPAYQAAQTKYQLGNTTKFIYSYSFLLYERLILLLDKSPEENFLEVEIKIDTLKEWFGIQDKYKDKNGNFTYGPFKKKILLRAIDDINKHDENGNAVCNINLTFVEKKIGKRVASIVFHVSKVHGDNYYNAKPVLNSYRNALDIDQQALYDLFMNFDITRQEVETAIMKYPVDKLKAIYSYMNSKKNRGPAYLAAIIKNGWTGNEQVKAEQINLQNIEKAFTMNPIFSNILVYLKDFLDMQDSRTQDFVINLVLEKFKTEQPELYEYFKGHTAKEILESRHMSILIIEEADYILKSEHPSIYNNFAKYLSERQNATPLVPGKPVERKKAAKLPKGRDEIIGVLNNFNIYDTDVLIELLANDDAYINENIKYCKGKYSDKASDEFTSLLISALRKDFAGYNAKMEKIRAEEERKKNEEQLKEMLKSLDIAEVEELARNATDKMYKELAEKELAQREVERKAREEAAAEQALQDKVNSMTDSELQEIFSAIQKSSEADIRVKYLAQRYPANKLDNIKEEILTNVTLKLVFRDYFGGKYRK